MKSFRCRNCDKEFDLGDVVETIVIEATPEEVKMGYVHSDCASEFRVKVLTNARVRSRKERRRSARESDGGGEQS